MIQGRPLFTYSRTLLLYTNKVEFSKLCNFVSSRNTMIKQPISQVLENQNILIAALTLLFIIIIMLLVLNAATWPVGPWDPIIPIAFRFPSSLATVLSLLTYREELSPQLKGYCAENIASTSTIISILFLSYKLQ